MKSLAKYSGTWGRLQLKHLLNRTLFGIKKGDYDAFKEKNMEECVRLLLTETAVPAPPVIESTDPEEPKGTSFVFAPEHNEESRITILKGWWAGQMIHQPQSIAQKMILFWHNHFVVEFNNVKDSRYAYQYLHLLQKNALGNAKKLTKEITKNACMLVYLNGNQNRKQAPNENYGRELQELFTIGKGVDSHYTEADVKAAARVLTGWKDDKKNITSYFDAELHDTGDKVFSAFYNNHVIKGKAGNEGAKELDELVEMIFENKETAKFLCRKLYRWFVHFDINERVEKEVITPLAELMIASDYNIKPVLEALFTSDFFYNEYLVGGMFKSPTDYLVRLLREFEVHFSKGNSGNDYAQLWAISVTLGLMGQDIGDPPSVAGWTAYYEYPFFYKVWINSENLTYRAKLARLLSYPEESDRLLMIDFINFVSKFPSVENSKMLLADILDLLCAIQPGASKTAYLESLLDSDGKWKELWKRYKANPHNEDSKKMVINRLRKVFDVIFIMPEYQVM